MTSEETITLTRREYDALIERNSQSPSAACQKDELRREVHAIAILESPIQPRAGALSQ